MPLILFIFKIILKQDHFYWKMGKLTFRLKELYFINGVDVNEVNDNIKYAL